MFDDPIDDDIAIFQKNPSLLGQELYEMRLAILEGPRQVKEKKKKNKKKSVVILKSHYLSSFVSRSLLSHLDFEFQNYELPAGIDIPKKSKGKVLRLTTTQADDNDGGVNYLCEKIENSATDWRTRFRGTTQITKFITPTRYHKIAISLVSNSENFDDILQFQQLYIQVFIIHMYSNAISDLEYYFQRFVETKKFVFKSFGLVLHPELIAVLTTRQPRVGDFKRSKLTIEVKSGSTVIITADRSFASKSSKKAIYVNCIDYIKKIQKNDFIIIGNLIKLQVIRQINISAECFVQKGGLIKALDRVEFSSINIKKDTMSQEELDDLNFVLLNEIKTVTICEEEYYIYDEIKHFFNTNDFKNYRIFIKIFAEEFPENLTADICKYIKNITKKFDGLYLCLHKFYNNKEQEIRLSNTTKYIMEQFSRACKPILVGHFFSPLNVLKQEILIEKDSYKHFYHLPDKFVCNSFQIRNFTYHRALINLIDNALLAIDEFVAFEFNELKAFSSKKAPPSVLFFENVVRLSYQMNASAIIVLSKTGKSARTISHYHPKCPIIVLTNNYLLRFLNMYHYIWIAYYHTPVRSSEPTYWTETLRKLVYGLFFIIKVNIVTNCEDKVIYVYRESRTSTYPDKISLIKAEATIFKKFLHLEKKKRN